MLDRLLTDPTTRVAHLRDGHARLDGDALALRPPISGDAEAHERSLTGEPGGSVHVFLGRSPEGAAHVARLDSERAPGAADLRSRREVVARLNDLDAGIVTTALALANWHGAHPRCPRCGGRTVPANAGWTRYCPVEGSQHYPRTDPAIIVAVTDADDRLLLGHNRGWPDGRFSTLAGFVEPGESLEDAVRREVAEESGIVVGEVTYLGSQPWPFPASLMLGCSAQALTTEISVDDDEVTEARWFTRDELVGEISAGTVIGPGPDSIANRLLAHWLGAQVPPGPIRW